MSMISQLTHEAPPLARFALILVLVVIVPFAGRRLRLPDCVSFILVGVIVGPHLLGIAPEHGSVLDFFGGLGKLLLMFFVGLEVDFRQFTENRVKAGQFGLLTFALPMIEPPRVSRRLFGLSYAAMGVCSSIA